MIVFVNNRDFFVWNLVEYVFFFDRVKVVLNIIIVGEFRRFDFDGVIIFFGLGYLFERREVGNLLEIVFGVGVFIFGVCFGY